MAATCAGSKPWNAFRMPFHLASTARQIPASKTARDRWARKNAGSSGAWSRNFSNGAVRGSAAAVSPDFIRAVSAVASSWVRV
jgi:hypothetical protein